MLWEHSQDIDMEEGIFSPSLSFTTSYNYSSNPLKAEDNSGSALMMDLRPISTWHLILVFVKTIG